MKDYRKLTIISDINEQIKLIEKIEKNWIIVDEKILEKKNYF